MPQLSALAVQLSVLCVWVWRAAVLGGGCRCHSTACGLFDCLKQAAEGTGDPVLLCRLSAVKSFVVHAYVIPPDPIFVCRSCAMTSSGVDSVRVQTHTAPLLSASCHSIVLCTTGDCPHCCGVVDDTSQRFHAVCVSVLLLRASQYQQGSPLCVVLSFVLLGFPNPSSWVSLQLCSLFFSGL